MINRQQKWFLWSEILISWLVLLALFYYTYIELVRAPYLGFHYNATTGVVQSLYLPSPNNVVKEDDRLVRVGDLTFEQWRSQMRAPLFPAATTSGLVELEFERAGQRSVVQWPLNRFNWDEFRFRSYNVWWMGYLFWLTGLATLLLVRPLDAKRTLFAAFFMLTALWLVVGNTSRWGIGDSRLIYRLALCVSVPVLLHLHWLFPRPLGKIPLWLLWLVYGATLIVCVLHYTPLIAPGLATLAFGIALLGSLALLGAHYFFQPTARRQVRLLFYGLLFATAPIVALALTVTFNDTPHVWTYALITLPLVPGAYFYSIYRFQLGGSEFRANRLIVVYLYVILLGTIVLIMTALLSLSPAFGGSEVMWATLIALTTALITLYGFPLFQRWIERRLLAMPLPPVQLIETHLARITTSLSETSLVDLLKNNVMPSLLIRESALLRIRNPDEKHFSATVFYASAPDLLPALADGSALDIRPLEGVLARLQAAPLVRVNPQVRVMPLVGVINVPELAAPSWVRLALALHAEGKLIGVWLLGRHDPDDHYAPGDVATLQTLARQTALALTNIGQAAQLQALYQASIERQEQERIKMAHFLHDAILNQAAHLYMSLDVATLTPRVEVAYETLKELIHQMVSNLRPPSLDFGLAAALEELANEFDQRATTSFVLHLHVPTAGVTYPAHIENHIFRIVQQACENAFRHARADVIQISGTLAPDAVELVVEDDGTGFEVGKPPDMADLLAHKHFGLVHMMERAEHIRAELALDSVPGQGTRMRLMWSAQHVPLA